MKVNSEPLVFHCLKHPVYVCNEMNLRLIRIAQIESVVFFSNFIFRRLMAYLH